MPADTAPTVPTISPDASLDDLHYLCCLFDVLDMQTRQDPAPPIARAYLEQVASLARQRFYKADQLCMQLDRLLETPQHP